MSVIAESVRYLVDLALFPQALEQLYRLDARPRCEPLYLTTGHAESAYSGPLLVEPGQGSRDWLREGVKQGWAIALHGHAEWGILTAHCRSLITVTTDTGRPTLLRFADPRVWAGLAPALNEAEQARVLGPLLWMHGRGGSDDWMLANPEPFEPTRNDTPLYVNPTHFDALQHWRERQMATQLGHTTGADPALIFTWLSQIKPLQWPSETACWQACERLAQLGFMQPITQPHLDLLMDENSHWQIAIERLVALSSSQVALEPLHEPPEARP